LVGDRNTSEIVYHTEALRSFPVTFNMATKSFIKEVQLIDNTLIYSDITI